MMYLLAHDLGTSGNKATLFSIDGKLVKSVVHPYQTRFFNNTWAEQDADDWWQAVCRSTRDILQDIDPEDVAVVSFSGQMMGCLCVDAQGRPLRKAIIWADQRAVREMNDIKERIDEARFYAITGHRVSASYTLQKLMWIKNNEPEVYASTDKVLNAKDYILFKLTGRFVTDYSDGTGTNMVDLNTLKWSDEIISTMAIDGSKLPDLHASTDVVGLVTAAAAAATGLSTRTKVVCGGGDGVCAAVGAGCIREGVAYQVVGSSSWISLTTEKPVFDENRRTFNWAHIIPGYVAPCGTMQAAGVSYNWLKNTICASEVMAAEERGISPYQLMDAAAEQSTVGSHGLLFLPYLMGERSPRWNPNARGAFIGLKVEHKREDMIRSVLEGITLNMNVILDVYKQVVDIKELVVIGAGAKGRIWRQIMADIYGVHVLKMNVLEEATSMGAAVTGGVGAGIYKSFSVIDQYIHVDEIQTPDPANRLKYQQLMPIFEASYASLVQVYESLADLS